ncbi:MAG: hypothetical protein AB1715_13120, partial [Acidobacteriota bacterium]
VAFIQVKGPKKQDNGGEGKNPTELTPGGKKPGPPRTPESYEMPVVDNTYPMATYLKVLEKNIFGKTVSEGPGGAGQEPEWAAIKVKSIFDPTRSGSFIAVIEVDKVTRFVKEGESFEGYEIQRIDGVKNCLTIVRRRSGRAKGEKEFCKEE